MGATASYLRQSVRTNAAAPVAVGAVKPTSTYSLESVPVQLQVFAHLSEAVDPVPAGGCPLPLQLRALS